MNLDAIKMLYDYNYSARDKVWACVTQLTEEQYRKLLDYSVGSIHEQVVHMMMAEHMWFYRLKGQSPTSFWAGKDFEDRNAVWERWGEVKQMVLDHINDLTEDELAGVSEYTTTSGQPYSQPTVGILLHVVNHATDHRAQTLAMIHQLGGETGPQDLIYYLRDL